jgi:hypothetical protein
MFCPRSSPSYLYRWAKGEGTSSFNRIFNFGEPLKFRLSFRDGTIKELAHSQKTKKKSWTCEAPPTNKCETEYQISTPSLSHIKNRKLSRASPNFRLFTCAAANIGDRKSKYLKTFERMFFSKFQRLHKCMHKDLGWKSNWIECFYKQHLPATWMNTGRRGTVVDDKRGFGRRGGEGLLQLLLLYMGFGFLLCWVFGACVCVSSRLRSSQFLVDRQHRVLWRWRRWRHRLLL